MSHTPQSAPVTPAPAPERELELDLVAPGVLAAVLAAITGVFVGATRATVAAARIALGLAIEPARSWPEGPERARARAALAVKRAEIEAVERALDAAPTVAQPIPRYGAGGYGPHGAGCLCTLCEGIRTNAAPVAPKLVSVPASAPVPAFIQEWEGVRVSTHDARWAMIKVKNHARTGEWGATVESNDVRIGDKLRVHRASGNAAPTVKYVTEIITATSRGTLVAHSDAAPIAAPVAAGTAPIAAPVEVEIDWSEPSDAAVTAAATLSQSALVEAAQQASALDASNTGTLEQALGAVAAQGENIVASAAQGAAAHATRLGVGFSDPAQYLQALRNGGLQPATRADYIARCRSAGLTFDESTLPPANAPTAPIALNAAFATNSTTHVPEGKPFHLMTRTERKALNKIGRETRAAVSKLLDESAIIAGAVAAGNMLQASWTGKGSTTLGAVREALAAIGREDGPKAPSAERHAGRAVESLRGRDLDTARLPSKDLDEGISARWLIGRKLTGAAVKAGESYGAALLIVTLTDGGELRFDGDAELQGAVLAHYNGATAAETLRSEDMTAWLADRLYSAHHSVKRGHVWYVPAGEADAVRALFAAIEPLWGDQETIPVTTGKDLAKSLTRGLGAELDALDGDIAKDLATAQTRAATKARSDEHTACTERSRKSVRIGGPALTLEAIEACCVAAADKASERATLTPHMAAKHLTTLATIASRIEGYRTVLGDETVKGARDRMIALRNALEPLCTDADQRATMLEFS